jgi:FkbM family methyltransferase
MVDPGSLMIEQSSTPYDDAGQGRHHPLIALHDPVAVPCPAGFDCDFLGVRTRRAFNSGMVAEGLQTSRPPEFPGFDDEYFEWIDVLEAVDQAHETFVMIELGAGYGRWCARAAAAIRRKGNCRYQLVAVEAEPAHFRWMHEHFRDNDIDPGDHELIWAVVQARPGFVPFWVGAADCWYGQAIAVGQALPLPDTGTRRRLKARSALGRPPVITSNERTATWIPCVTLAEVLAPYARVDLLDLDVQGEEYDVLASAIDLVDERVRRLHIGTHSPQVEQQLRQLLSAHSWQNINDYPGQSTTQTPYGAIQFGDGVQTWVNPVMRAVSARPFERSKARRAPRTDHAKLLRRLRSRLEHLKEQNDELRRQNAELCERDRTRDAQVHALKQSGSWPMRLAQRWLPWPRRQR